MGDLPTHGTRSRYRAPWGCRCLYCSGRTRMPPGATLRWPLFALERRVGHDRLAMWVEPEKIEEWRESGLSDSEADSVAIMLGMMPTGIWGGYQTAGLDYRDTYE